MTAPIGDPVQGDPDLLLNGVDLHAFRGDGETLAIAGAFLRRRRSRAYQPEGRRWRGRTLASGALSLPGGQIVGQGGARPSRIEETQGGFQRGREGLVPGQVAEEAGQAEERPWILPTGSGARL